MTRFVSSPTYLADNKAVNYALFTARPWGRVLELGPYDGTDTVALSRHCDELVSVEGRLGNIETVNNVIAASGTKNATVIHANLDTFDITTLGKFDCVWASGILYHLSRPWMLVKAIAEVSPQCYGWSHLTEIIEGQHGGYSGRWFQECDLPLAGLSDRSWWLTPSDFQRMWADAHMSCAFTTPPCPHMNGGLEAQFHVVRTA